MAKRNNQQNPSKTNAQEVRKQNQRAAQGNNFGTEFAEETNAQEVRKQNQKSQNNKR